MLLRGAREGVAGRGAVGRLFTFTAHQARWAVSTRPRRRSLLRTTRLRTQPPTHQHEADQPPPPPPNQPNTAQTAVTAVDESEQQEEVRKLALAALLRASSCRVGTVTLPPPLLHALSNTLSGARGKQLLAIAAPLSAKLRASQGSLDRAAQLALRHALKDEEVRQLADRQREHALSLRRQRRQQRQAAKGAAVEAEVIGSDPHHTTPTATGEGGGGGEGGSLGASTGAGAVGQEGAEGPTVKQLADTHPVFLSALAVDIARQKGLSHIQYDQGEALAYAALRFPSTFAVVLRVLREIHNRDPRFVPSSLLDFGSGPGTAMWASHFVWSRTSRARFDDFANLQGKLRRGEGWWKQGNAAANSKGRVFSRVVNVEFSPHMREVGEQLAKVAGFPEPCVWSRSLPSMSLFVRPSDAARFSHHPQPQATGHGQGGEGERGEGGEGGEGGGVPPLLSPLPAPNYDLVTATYSLNELRTLEDRVDMAVMLWERVEAGGLLVVVEPGTPFGFSNIKAVRHALLDLFPNECSVFAPCPHSGECPKAADSWCHFVQRLNRPPEQRRAKAGTNKGYEDEKFSYLVLRKGPRDPRTPLPPSLPSSHAELEGFKAGLGAAAWGRLVEEPRKRGGHVLVGLCTAQGKLETRVVAKSEKKRSFAYKLAKKLGWGDQFPYN